MSKKIFNVILISLIAVFVLSCTTLCFAGVLDEMNVDTGGATEIVSKGNQIIGYVQAVGVITAVVMLIFLGIKYTTCSIGEKAQVKQTLIPFFIGSILIFGAVGVLQVIKSLNLF